MEDDKKTLQEVDGHERLKILFQGSDLHNRRLEEIRKFARMFHLSNCEGSWYRKPVCSIKLPEWPGAYLLVEEVLSPLGVPFVRLRTEVNVEFVLGHQDLPREFVHHVYEELPRLLSNLELAFKWMPDLVRFYEKSARRG
jgi:hypothetical protein